MVENLKEERIKKLRSDNGTEYINERFKKALKRWGIRHQTSVPYNPEQNGLAERVNRTLTEKARSMLYDAELPKVFWAEAVNTAAYIVNRSPHKSLNCTPQELWSKKKPNVSHFKIFGCLSMSLVPKQNRKKWDSKADKGIFVGYGMYTKGYRIYDENKRKVITIRDAKFDENKKGFYLLQPKEKDHYFFSYEDMSENRSPLDTISLHENEDSNCSSLSFNSINDNEVGEHLNTTQTTSGNKANGISGRSDCSSLKDNDVLQEFVPRRSERLANKEKVSWNWISYCVKRLEDEPESIEEALSSTEKDMWQKAIDNELCSIEENQTWEIVPKPQNANLIKSKWVFKKKKEQNNTVRYKARLVVKGYTQKKGIDYEETFSPVVRYTSIRYLIALAAKHNLKIEQMDAVTAFLQGDLVENVYVEPPSIVKVPNGCVLKLRKALYGLKQASHVWNNKLNDVLQKYGMKRSKLDPCIYYHIEGSKITLMALYVDDMLLFTNATIYYFLHNV